jgi:hypothetical protein
MLQTVSRLLPELLPIVMIAVATHLVMSFAQTLMHWRDRGFSGLHGSGGSRNCTLFITGTRTAISR